MSNSYFIEQGIIPTEVLVSNQLMYASTSVDGVPGIVLYDTDYEKLSQIINLQVTELTETSIQGLIRANFNGGTSTGVEWRNVNTTQTRQQPPATPRSAPASNVVLPDNDHMVRITGKKIIIHKPSGKAEEPISDGNFHIWVHAYHPDNQGNMTSTSQPNNLFGRRIESNRRSYFAPNTTRPNMIMDGNRAVAEVYPDNLYVFFSLSFLYDYGSCDDHRGLSAIIRQLVNHPFNEDDKKRFADISKSEFIEYSDRLMEKTIQDYRAHIDDYSAKISKLLSDLTTVRQKKQQTEHLLFLATNDTEDRKKKLNLEYELIRNTKSVENVFVEGNILTVMTGNITCVDERSQVAHDLGKFRITIRMDNSDVRFYNLTRHQGEMAAPHVRRNGEACFGNFSETISELCGSGQVAILVQMCIRYLQSANTSDQWGTKICYWPLVNAEDANKWYEAFTERSRSTGFCTCDDCIGHMTSTRIDGGIDDPSVLPVEILRARNNNCSHNSEVSDEDEGEGEDEDEGWDDTTDADPDDAADED